MNRTLTAAALTLLVGTGAALAAAMRPAPPIGPGAVIEMQRELFAAIDAGDTERALAFLHEDMHMQRSWGKRPCTLFLPESGEGTTTARDHAQSRAALRRFVEEGKGWKTEVTEATADCSSEDVSWAVLELTRRREVEGREVERRLRATALVTYDDGWKLTHWHVSPADAPAR